jgi:hypothetical protein
MHLQTLTDDEKRVVFECLRAAVDGPFFPEWEFPSLFGLQRSELAKIVEALPDIDDSDERVSLAINDVMNNLLGYPHGQDSVWAQFISAPRTEVRRVLEIWHEKTNA